MKIALFSETYLPLINGVATHVKTLKDGLEALGHQVLVVTADAKAASHRIEDGVLRCPAMELKELYGFGLAAAYSPERARLLRAFDPDIVHAHTEFNIGFAGVDLAKELHVPLIYTLHTMWDEYLHYVASPTFMPAIRGLAHSYFKYFANHASAIIGPSGKVQTFLHNCGVKKEVTVIPNAVELSQFSKEQTDGAAVAKRRRDYGIRPDDLVIGFCGRLAQEKSVHVLLDYFAYCYEKERRLKLIIIGDGPARAALEFQAQQPGLTDSVVFTGGIPHDAVHEVYACCDLYATASKSEVNSISMLEAMAMGLPVLHILDEANAGQVVDGVNGYVFRDAQELCRLLLGYRDRSPAEKKLLQDSVTASVGHASQAEMAQTVEELYLRHMKVETPVSELPRPKGDDSNDIF